MAKQQIAADVVVVGGGLSGLVAARTLRRGGCSVVVLEANTRLGGRLVSHVFPDGGHADLGGQWFGPGQNRILKLAAELVLASHPTLTRGRTAYEFGRQRGSYSGSLPWLNPLLLFGVLIGFWRLSLTVKRFKRNPHWGSAQAARLDRQSVSDWIGANVWTEGARKFMRLTLEGILCCDLDQVSLLVLLYAVAGSGSLEHMFAVQGGAQERQFTGGTQTLVSGVAQELTGCIYLNHAVARIEHRADGAVVRGESFDAHCKYVVMAVPGPLLSAIDFCPGLGTRRQTLIEHMAMGSVVKCAVQYPRAFWRDAGLSGALWSDRGPVDVAYDTSSSDSSHAHLSLIATASRAQHLRSLSPEKRRTAVLTSLARHFGEQAMDCLDYADKVWADEPWAGGGYAAHLPAGQFADGMSALRLSEGVLHWAGTETASEWPGYMEGAIEAGERSASEILERRPIG